MSLPESIKNDILSAISQIQDGNPAKAAGILDGLVAEDGGATNVVPSHAPEPWRVGKGSFMGLAVLDADSDGVCACSTGLQPLYAGDEEAKRANARRIVACVNACAGLNPEAVPDLLAACEAVRLGSGVVSDNCWGIVVAAIAKAKGGAA